MSHTHRVAALLVACEPSSFRRPRQAAYSGSLRCGIRSGVVRPSGLVLPSGSSTSQAHRLSALPFGEGGKLDGMRSARIALESALAGSTAADDEEDSEAESTEGLPVWCHNNAMLPGFREILGVHQPWLINMFSRLMNGTKPWRYVHFSSSSSFISRGDLSMTVEALYHKPTKQDSAIRPEADTMRPAMGTLMEVALADKSEDGRLFLAVRALGPVQLKRVVQRSPYLRAVVEWRPDIEEVEAYGGEAPAVCAGEVWAEAFESPLSEGELEGMRPIHQHLVEVAKHFYELAPPVADCNSAAQQVDDAVFWASTPAQRSLSAAASEAPATDDMTAPLWATLHRIEELQGSISEIEGKGSAPAPSAARAMRPVVSPQIAQALQPLLDESPAVWCAVRRARWLSYAAAAMLPEIALGPGRQALLEASSTADRLSLIYDVLVARRDSLSALYTLQSLKSKSVDEAPVSEDSSGVEDEQQPRGVTLREAARLERMMGGLGGPGAGVEGDAWEKKQREKRHARKRWLQQKAIQDAAECTIEHGGDDSECVDLWDRVKELSNQPTADLDLDEEEEDDSPRK